ncbi:MAG TPA: hypothetical protein VFR94_10405 [Nitrososphaeraceae archaeon]|nr:hypothetical protein [Nitrososphaeraceae archaeon]
MISLLEDKNIPGLRYYPLLIPLLLTYNITISRNGNDTAGGEM